MIRIAILRFTWNQTLPTPEVDRTNQTALKRKSQGMIDSARIEHVQHLTNAMTLHLRRCFFERSLRLDSNDETKCSASHIWQGQNVRRRVLYFCSRKALKTIFEDTRRVKASRKTSKVLTCKERGKQNRVSACLILVRTYVFELFH